MRVNACVRCATERFLFFNSHFESSTNAFKILFFFFPNKGHKDNRITALRAGILWRGRLNAGSAKREEGKREISFDFAELEGRKRDEGWRLRRTRRRRRRQVLEQPPGTNNLRM